MRPLALRPEDRQHLRRGRAGVAEPVADRLVVHRLLGTGVATAGFSDSIKTMTDSGDIVQLDHTRFAASSAALDDRLAEMVARRREVGDAVDRLLREWRGEAATAFLSSWDAWRDGADEVIDDLRRDVGSLDTARTDLHSADSRSSHAASPLRGRLG